MSRSISLPTSRIAPTRQDPRLTIIYSNPKIGKTTLLNTLPNNMNLDLEGGTAFLDSLSMHIIGIYPPSDETDEQFDARMALAVPQYYLMEAGTAIMLAGRPYDFITLDTCTKLEDLVLPLAAQMYKSTP